MNKRLFLLFAAALVLTAGGQTNVIKISQLPTVSSLSGSEKFPCVQGGSNYIATTLQIQLAPMNSINIASNNLATNAMTYSNLLSGLLTSEIAARLTQVSTVSNLSTVAILNNSNLCYSGSNALWLLLTNTTTSLFTASNANWVATSNANYTATNSAATLAAAAPTLANAITNGGNSTVAIVTVTNLIEPSVPWSGTISGSMMSQTTIPINLGSSIRANLNPQANGNIYLISATNILDGQNVTILIKNISAVNTGYIQLGTLPQSYGVFNTSNPGQMTIQPGKSGIASFSVIYTNIIYSQSAIN